MSEKKKEEKKYGFDWGLEPKPVYKPEDVRGIEYEKDIGNPVITPLSAAPFP